MAETTIKLTSGKCFLCLESFAKVESQQGAPDKEILAKVKMLLQYLKIDVLELCSIREVEEVILCAKCAPLMSEFAGWYQTAEDERERLCLNNCLNGTYDGIVNGDKKLEEISANPPRIVETLRDLVMNKCHASKMSELTTKLENSYPLIEDKKVDNHNSLDVTTVVSVKRNMENLAISTDFKDPTPARNAKNTSTVTCNFCNADFSKKGLSRHKKSRHAFQLYSTMLPPHATEGDLENVIISKINDVSKNRANLECVQCKKLPPLKRNELRLHILVKHLDEILLAVGGSPLATTVEKALPKKKSSKKPDDKVRLYFCQSCRMSFTTSGVFHRHKRSHLKTPHRIKCDFCTQCLINKSDLRMHMITHHLLQVVFNQVPPGTTEKELSAALLKIVEKCERLHCVNSGGRIKRRCLRCAVVCSKMQLIKVHIVDHHFEEVLDQVASVRLDLLLKAVAPNHDKQNEPCLSDQLRAQHDQGSTSGSTSTAHKMSSFFDESNLHQEAVHTMTGTETANNSSNYVEDEDDWKFKFFDWDVVLRELLLPKNS